MTSPMDYKMATKIYPTEQDENNIHLFLDYMATYSNAVIRFHASGMILHDTHVSYLNKPQSCSRAAGYFFLDSIPSNFAQKCLNGPIYFNCNILKFVVASAEESEIGGCFVTGICHHYTKHVKRNVPPTSHYTRIHKKYNSCWN